MVDLEKQKKKKRRRGPLMQRGFSPFFLFMGIQYKSSPPPPKKKEKNALFQAFQTGFLITQFSFLTVVHFTVCNIHKVPCVILSARIITHLFQVFILKEQNVGIFSVFPPAKHMLQPRAPVRWNQIQ